MARGKINPETGLTDKQEAYCRARAYNPKWTQSDCYRHAYNCEGMSLTTINNKAYQLELKDQIRAMVDKLKSEVAEEAKIDAAYVLRRHAEIDQMDVLDIMGEDGGLLPLSDWPKVWRQFISGMALAEMLEGYGDDRKIVGMLKKIKWPDKLKNLELLGKHIEVGAYREKVVIQQDEPLDLSDLSPAERAQLKAILERNIEEE